MPKELNGLSVFVASPGGLEPERKVFFDTITRFNVDDGHEGGVAFIPQGHELAFAGAGRPQAKINQQVRDSDYLIVVFWDKWGFPTSDSGPYSSGTEEEYAVGLSCLEDGGKPMRDVVVFFKGPSDRQMSDPGIQLQKVLSFRKQLEAERRVLYRTFDDLSEFEHELQRLLGKWSRDWTNGQPAKAQLPAVKIALKADTVEISGSLVYRAKLAAKNGQTTLAHELFTQATTGTYDREAWTEYVRFLRRGGRFGRLQVVGDQMIEKALDLNDHLGAAEGLSNFGIAKRSQGQRVASLRYFDRALGEIDRGEAEAGSSDETASMRAFLLDNRGLTLRRMRDRLPEAISAIEEAISLHETVGDERGQAHGLRNIGVVHAQLGNLSESLSALELAKSKFEELEDERGQAITLSSMGETLELSGDIGAATECYEVALAINTSLHNGQGKSMNLSQLSRALVSQGDLKGASDYAEACMELNELSGSTEGLAAAFHALGRVGLAEQDYGHAAESLRQGLELFRGLDQPAGVAGTAIDLSLAYLGLAMPMDARTAYDLALDTLDDSPHFGLSRQARGLERALSAPEQTTRS